MAFNRWKIRAMDSIVVECDSKVHNFEFQNAYLDIFCVCVCFCRCLAMLLLDLARSPWIRQCTIHIPHRIHTMDFNLLSFMLIYFISFSSNGCWAQRLRCFIISSPHSFGRLAEFLLFAGFFRDVICLDWHSELCVTEQIQKHRRQFADN